MANIKSAIKRHRQSEKRNTRNRSFKTLMKGRVKKVRTLLGNAKAKADDTLQTMREAQATIARLASKGIIKPRTAARKISRLQKHVNGKISG